MTSYRFYQDAYQTELETRVVRIFSKKPMHTKQTNQCRIGRLNHLSGLPVQPVRFE